MRSHRVLSPSVRRKAVRHSDLIMFMVIVVGGGAALMVAALTII